MVKLALVSMNGPALKSIPSLRKSYQGKKIVDSIFLVRVIALANREKKKPLQKIELKYKCKSHG